jgi:hypothetical protein
MKHLSFACAFLMLVSCVLPAQTNPVPFINQPLVPETAVPDSGGFTLTVHGAGFAPTAVLKWNGSARATVVVSASLLQATIPASDVANSASVTVTVVNMDTHNETSNVAYFMVRNPTPSVALIPSQTFSATGFVADGDFNNDGKLDVVVCNSTNGRLRLVIDAYLGEGKLKFQSPIETVIKGQFNNIGPIIAGDFNGDHKLDLAVKFKGGGRWQIAILFGDGTGKFTLGPKTPVAEGGSMFPAGDVNGDGNLDLLTTSYDRYGDASLNVWFGNGDGTFIEGGGIFSSSFGFGTPVVGDFNEDGNLDLAVSANGDGFIVVALNQGAGKFGEAVTYQTSSGTSSVVAADVNGDGHLDLVTNYGAVLLGKGDGTFTNGEGAVFGGGSPLVSGDFNGDGKLDLVSPGNPILVLLGNGDGTFQPAISAGYGFIASQGVATGAFRPDGRFDLVGSGGLFWQVPADLYPPSLNFGQQNVGTQSQPQTATLVNADALPLPVTQIAINGANSTEFSQTNNCPASIPVGGSCQIQITFAPKSQGNKSASLSVSYKGPGSPQSVALTGTGVGATSVSLTPSKLAFATRMINTTSSAQTATLTNTGSEAVTISSISTALPFSQTNNCPATLPVGQNCQIQVTFAPTTVGQANGTLSVTDNAPDSPQTVALSGIGSLITFSPIGIFFGNQNVGTSSNPVPVTLRNKGTVTLNISKIVIGGADPGDFSQTNNCGSTVPAGGQCTIQVTFSPTQKGTRSAKLQVYDDVEPSPQGVALGGTGT